MELLSFTKRLPQRSDADGRHRIVRRTAERALGAALLVIAAAPVGAQTVTGPVNVTQLRTGWNADSFAVVTLQPVANPAGCPIPDGYISTKPAPGFTTYYEAARIAFQMNARAQMSVDNKACVSGRPKIIGINVLR